MPRAKRSRQTSRETSSPSEGGADVTRRPAKRARVTRDPPEGHGMSDRPAEGQDSAEGPTLRRPSAVARTQKSKGLDAKARPITEFPDMIDDMVARALDVLIGPVNDYLRHVVVTVATMCSGTEAPLISLQEISEALRRRNLQFAFQHLFSCEIEPAKQAFIERNFKPAVIFTDVRDLALKAEA